MTELHTRRLTLRPVNMADLGDVFTYSRGQNVGPNAGWKPHENLGETAEVLKHMFVGKEGVFGVVLQSTGRLIGTIGLVPDARREGTGVQMLGYAIGEAHWGHGYTTEAATALLKYGFGAMGLTMVSAYCYPHNARSRRVLEKCGFSYEGTLRGAEQLYNGAILDVECFSLTQGEFACNTGAKTV